MALMKTEPAKQPKIDPVPTEPDDVWRILGLAVRAGLAVTGTLAIEQVLYRRKACLVLLASDAAENSRRKLSRLCRQQDVQVLEFGSMAEIGHWTGHESRAAAAILDPGFAGRLKQLIGAIEKPVTEI